MGHLYSIESPASQQRLSGKVIVPDTSFCIPLREKPHRHWSAVSQFHLNSLSRNAAFLINVIIRQEHLQRIRYLHLVEAIAKATNANPRLESRYRQILGNTVDPIDKLIEQNAERLLKNHIKVGDHSQVDSHMTMDIWSEYTRFEHDAALIYMSGSANDSWDHLGSLLHTSKMEPADAMILNFARYIDADAIATADIGFAAAVSLIDIYMPLRIARQCARLYDPNLDR